MKTKYFIHLAVVVGFLGLTAGSCDKGKDIVLSDEQKTQTVSQQSGESDNNVLDALNVADDAFDGSDDGRVGGRSEGCATVTHNEANRTVTIDFGSGCTGVGNITRKGKITVQYTGRREGRPQRVVTYDNFGTNSYTISGTVNVSSVQLSGTSNFVFEMGGTNLTLTLKDGKKVTITQMSRRTQVSLGANLLSLEDDEISITGSASGVNESGVTFTSTITSPLIIRGRCIGSAAVFYPVKGKQEIKALNLTATVDWGNDVCDKIMTLTLLGKTETYTLP